jgi:hypothetical protein
MAVGTFVVVISARQETSTWLSLYSVILEAACHYSGATGAIMDTNLLQETIDMLAELDLSPIDVYWVGTRDGTFMEKQCAE